MAGRLAGQTINDRLLAARHSIAGQGLAKAVCKATTEEMIGPKKKHLDYLVHCTNEPNVSIPQLANLLIERSQHGNWVVVYKALVTCHHVMCYGNERFTQFLASNNTTFQLSNFSDKGGLQGYEMSPFIRKYSKYLNEKALSYRSVAFDFCKVKRGKEDGLLRTMNAEKLLKTIPVLQNQLGALLEFDCSANDLTNGIINMCFMLLFRDLIRLFACYNDAIINLLEKYFDMNKKQCKEALEIYKKFLIRMDSVGEFLKVAENVGIDKGDIPDLTKAPSSLLEALEQHYNYMEGKKSTSGSASASAASSTTNQKNVKSAVSALNSTSNAFGNVASSDRLDSVENGIDESLKLKALAEEEAAMNQFKSKVSSTTATANNPFLSEPPAELFGAAPPARPPPKASDDLLQLGNPFVDGFGQTPVFTAQQQTNAWVLNGNGYGSTTPLNSFVTDNSFVSVFGNTVAPEANQFSPPVQNPFLTDETLNPFMFQCRNASSGPFDSLGGVLQPMNSNGGATSSSTTASSTNNNNPVNGNQANNGNLLTGDLESSLASLAENLTINDRKQTIKGVQWNSPKNSSKPSWTPQPMSATTGAGYKPMNQQLAGQTPFSANFNLNPTPTATPPMLYPQLMPVAGKPIQSQPNNINSQHLLFN